MAVSFLELSSLKGWSVTFMSTFLFQFLLSLTLKKLSRVNQITSPGWMHETSAWDWCTGKTQRDQVGREVWEGGSGWGTHVNPWLFHFNV